MKISCNKKEKIKKNISLAIDASRNRSGGAISHLKGILSSSNPTKFGIKTIHLWSYKKLLEQIPNYPWIVKHSHPLIENTIFHQIFWQICTFKKSFKNNNCDIVLNLDAGTFSNIHPCVTMSRDMLSYEKGISNRYGISFSRLRIFLLRYIQNKSLSNSTGVIFLTSYAAKVIQKYCGKISSYSIIPHGVGNHFKTKISLNLWPSSPNQIIECIYISNIDFYKNQITVLHAFHKLQMRGYKVKIKFVGDSNKLAKKLFLKEKLKVDPHNKFSCLINFVSNKDLPSLLKKAHLFVFASSCENMPNILIEGMASGLPIACSNAGPMPEILGDGGVFFDPTNVDSIFEAITKIIKNNKLRKRITSCSQNLSSKYSWEKCGNETWEYIYNVLKKFHLKNGC